MSALKCHDAPTKLVADVPIDMVPTADVPTVDAPIGDVASVDIAVCSSCRYTTDVSPCVLACLA